MIAYMEDSRWAQWSVDRCGITQAELDGRSLGKVMYWGSTVIRRSEGSRVRQERKLRKDVVLAEACPCPTLWGVLWCRPYHFGARVWPFVWLKDWPLTALCVGVTFRARKLLLSQGISPERGSCESTVANTHSIWRRVHQRRNLSRAQRVSTVRFQPSLFAQNQSPQSVTFGARVTAATHGTLNQQAVFLGDSSKASWVPGSDSRMSWVLELCHEINPWDLELFSTLASSKPSWEIPCVYVCTCMHCVQIYMWTMHRTHKKLLLVR